METTTKTPNPAIEKVHSLLSAVPFEVGVDAEDQPVIMKLLCAFLRPCDSELLNLRFERATALNKVEREFSEASTPDPEAPRFASLYAILEALDNDAHEIYADPSWLPPDDGGPETWMEKRQRFSNIGRAAILRVLEAANEVDALPPIPEAEIKARLAREKETEIARDEIELDYAARRLCVLAPKFKIGDSPAQDLTPEIVKESFDLPFIYALSEKVFDTRANLFAPKQ